MVTIIFCWSYFRRWKGYHVRYTDLPLENKHRIKALTIRILIPRVFDWLYAISTICVTANLENINSLNIDLLSSILIRMSTLKKFKACQFCLSMKVNFKNLRIDISKQLLEWADKYFHLESHVWMATKMDKIGVPLKGLSQQLVMVDGDPPQIQWAHN
jgi:hypothetical protein